jgi:hypothetical protein
MVLAGQQIQALEFAREHLAPMAAVDSNQLMRLMGALAFPNLKDAPQEYAAPVNTLCPTADVLGGSLFCIFRCSVAQVCEPTLGRSLARDARLVLGGDEESVRHSSWHSGQLVSADGAARSEDEHVHGSERWSRRLRLPRVF